MATTGWLTTLQQRSAAIAVYVGKLPRPLVLIVLIALVLGGLMVDGVLGAILLLLLALIGVWLMLLGWKVRSPAERIMRMVLLGLLVGAAGAKMLGLWIS